MLFFSVLPCEYYISMLTHLYANGNLEMFTYFLTVVKVDVDMFVQVSELIYAFIYLEEISRRGKSKSFFWLINKAFREKIFPQGI